MAKRMILGLAEDTSAMIEGVANDKAVSKLEIVRRALALYLLIQEEMKKDKKIKPALVKDGKIISTLVGI
jgi:hypothetical protein